MSRKFPFFLKAVIREHTYRTALLTEGEKELVGKKGEEMLKTLGIEYLFGSVALLRILSQLEKHVVLYRKIFDLQDASEISSNLLEGFKFAVIAVLHRIIIGCIESPELVGVRRSDTISQAHMYGNGKARSIRRLPDRSSHGILLSNLLAIRRAVLKAKSWDTLKSVFVRILEFSSWFDAIFASCYTGFSEEDEGKPFDPNNVLASKLPSVLLIFLNDADKLTRAFIDMYRYSRTERSHLDLRRFTRTLGTDPFEHEIGLDTMMKDRAFLEGFKFANLVLWYNVLGGELFWRKQSIFQRIRETVSWKEFDEFFRVLRDDIVLPLEEKKNLKSFYLSQIKKVPPTLRKRLITPLTTSKRRQLTLDDIFYYLPARVGSHEGSNGAMNFTIVLMGLVHAHIIGFMEDKAEVVEFIHKRKHGNNYSYALFLPCRSWIAEYSRWWVFYNCATDHSGAGGFNYRLIHSFINEYRKHISFRRFAIDEEDLLSYLKSDYVKFIEEESKKATDINALMRGALLELLVALYLSKEGFDVHVRHKSTTLGKEYDIVATKKTSEKKTLVYVVECKEKSVTVDSEEFSRLADETLETIRKDRQLQGPIGVTPDDIVFKELLEFNHEIEEVRRNIHKFIHELGVKKSKDFELRGIFATTELYRGREEIFPNVELWGWWTLKAKLTSAGIHKSFFEIIEKHLKAKVGRPITDLYFYRDYFD